MLRTRIITAILIAPVAFALVFLAPSEVFRTGVSVIWLLACLEYARLAALGKWATVALLVLQSAVFLLLFNFWDGISQLSLPALSAACLTWCIMFLRLITFRPGQGPRFGYSILGFGTAFVSLSFAWIGLVSLHDQTNGQFWILCLLIIVWAADIGAYFAGRALGGPRLAPRVSPAKTWSGFGGGLLLAVLAALLLTQLSPWYQIAAWKIATLAVITTVVSVGGDLFVSMQKRTVGLKDTGNLLPGHGGLLDRFDSLVSSAPFFALGVLVFSR